MFKERQGSCGPVRELSEVWMMLGRVETRSDLAAEGYDVELGCGGWRESLGTVGDSCWRWTSETKLAGAPGRSVASLLTRHK